MVALKAIANHHAAPIGQSDNCAYHQGSRRGDTDGNRGAETDETSARSYFTPIGTGRMTNDFHRIPATATATTSSTAVKTIRREKRSATNQLSFHLRN